MQLTGLTYLNAELLVLHGQLEGEPVRFMVDSGASASFVDVKLIKRHRWGAKPKGKADLIQLANGLAQGSDQGAT